MHPSHLGLILTTLAGLTTSIGSATVFFVTKPRMLPFAICMALSAGVMLYISFVEMFPSSQNYFLSAFIMKEPKTDEAILRRRAYLYTTVMFFVGWILTQILDKLVSCLLYAPIPRSHKKFGDTFKEKDSFEKIDGQVFGVKKDISNDSERLLEKYKVIDHGPFVASPVESSHQATSSNIDLNQYKAMEISHIAKMGKRYFAGQSETQHSTSPNIEDDSTKFQEELGEQIGITLGDKASNQVDQSDKIATRYPLHMRDSPDSESREVEIEGLVEDQSFIRQQCLRCHRRLKKITAGMSYHFLHVKVTEENAEILAFSAEQFEKQQHRMIRLGYLTALALFIHNFPEGVATYAGTLGNPKFGFGVAAAISLHNIPEGFSVSIPIYYGTKSKWKGFWLGVFSGLAEPVGAILTHFLSGGLMDDLLLGCVVAVVCGIMSHIALLELYVEAHRYDPTDQCVSKCFTFAMAFLASTLVLLQYVGLS